MLVTRCKPYRRIQSIGEAIAESCSTGREEYDPFPGAQHNRLHAGRNSQLRVLLEGSSIKLGAAANGVGLSCATALLQHCIQAQQGVIMLPSKVVLSVQPFQRVILCCSLVVYVTCTILSIKHSGAEVSTSSVAKGLLCLPCKSCLLSS